jgi:hypothetical protein
VLQAVWRFAGQPSGKYLAAVMDDHLERMVRFRSFGKVAHLATDQVLAEVAAMSAATIDRYLAAHKRAAYPVSLGSTKAARSHILRSSIGVRTGSDGPPAVPGTLHLDTVAHCGHTLKGDFLYSVDATCPLTGWTMIHTIKNKAHVHVHEALDWFVKHSPVLVTEMGFDNGSEFINWAVVAWADEHDITMTRGRPHKSNDNPYVEQRNWDWVRKHAYRYRYETPAEQALLNQLWELVMLRKNFLLPCVKAVGWTHTAAGRAKRVYDAPRTPYQRLLDTGVLDDKTAAKLAKIHHELDPARITRRINYLQNQLIDLAKARTLGTRPATRRTK